MVTQTRGCWRRAGQWKSCVEIAETIGERICQSVMVESLWQAAKWLGSVDDTDMRDVVSMKLLRMTNTATALNCRVLWMRRLERSEPVKLGCV